MKSECPRCESSLPLIQFAVCASGMVMYASIAPPRRLQVNLARVPRPPRLQKLFGSICKYIWYRAIRDASIAILGTTPPNSTGKSLRGAVAAAIVIYSPADCIPCHDIVRGIAADCTLRRRFRYLREPADWQSSLCVPPHRSDRSLTASSDTTIGVGTAFRCIDSEGSLSS